MAEEFVKITEVWVPVKKGGEAILLSKGKNIKRIALVANGVPLFLEQDCVIINRDISKEEHEQLRKSILKKDG